MKRLLLLTALLLCALCQAQNIELLHKANKCDAAFARAFADEIAKGFKGEYYFLEAKEYKKYNNYSIAYISASASNELKEKIKKFPEYAYSDECKECIAVHFKITDISTYTFDKVKSTFSNLFPFYQKNIDPTATTDKANDPSNVYSVRKDEAGYWYNFIRDKHGSWYLKNMSLRLNEFK